jgi:hypothetical protein
MEKKAKHLGLHVDPELHDKLKYLAAYEGRSINREVLYLIRREIEAFEREHGKIELPDNTEE